MKWIQTMVQRPALVSVIYIILLMFGLFSYSKLPVDMLPDMEAPVVTVVTAYPGAAALDVEDKISQPMEDALGSLANLKEIASTSRENVSILTLIFSADAKIDEATNDVRQSLERISNDLPKGSNRPMVMKFDFGQMPIVRFSITSSGRDVRLLKDEIEDYLVGPLSRVPGVGAVSLSNAPEKVVRIQVSREKLMSHGLTMSELSQVIAANNMNVPAGDISLGTMSFSMRVPGEVTNLDELRNMPVLKSPIGEGIVLLRDVAQVTLSLAESSEIALVNGESAILGSLRKTSDANTVSVTERAIAIFAQAENKLPDGTKILILEDGATFIKGTITNLQRTVMMGALLVSLVVLIFMRKIGPTLVVALSIPASMIVTFLVIYMFGYTLNSVTLIAMSLSVGMVVDNGVVALENISRKLDDGLGAIKAAYEGASEVGGALLASTTTTLVIFAPMIFISGIVGQMFAQLAVVMIVTVSASLFVAL
ncbi:MAG: efflux RND transporter permease subunit, partial [Myxococcota bacterium]|nr:efflux RND transporter permease subunit [Myxococcota bacterium]